MATAELLVDTDVLVDHLRGRRPLSAARPVAISVVSRCELFAGSDSPELLRRFLAPMAELSVDARVSEVAGMTRRATGIATADALIAATALVHGLPLMTRNRRHFDRVSQLRVVAPR